MKKVAYRICFLCGTGKPRLVFGEHKLAAVTEAGRRRPPRLAGLCEGCIKLLAKDCSR